jgi:hypothetical protein
MIQNISISEPLSFIRFDIAAAKPNNAATLRKHANAMDEQTTLELEAATFRQLVRHLQEHTEVQNIDLMILADFCRNCLAKWYSAAAKERGVALDYPSAQEIIYGIPYSEWKQKYQKDASPEQLRAMEETQRRKQDAGGH